MTFVSNKEMMLIIPKPAKIKAVPVGRRPTIRM
jgi:hypothetical protein